MAAHITRMAGDGRGRLSLGESYLVRDLAMAQKTEREEARRDYQERREAAVGGEDIAYLSAGSW